MQSFKDILRELREERGLSMKELGNAIGVSDAAICKWENGVAEPKLTYILRLADFFECSTDYILGRDDYYQLSYRDEHSETFGDKAYLVTASESDIRASKEILRYEPDTKKSELKARLKKRF